MTKAKKKKSQTLKTSPAIFGSSPIIPGESEDVYGELLLRATSALKPADIIDEMLLDDVVRGTWEIIRLRRLKNAMFNAAAHEALKRVLLPLVINQGGPFTSSTDRQFYVLGITWRAEELSEGWRAQDPEARSEVATLLKEADISLDEVMAEVLSMKIAEMSAIDSMIALAQDRRSAALVELDRRRAFFAQKVRQYTNDLELEAEAVKTLESNHDGSGSSGSENEPSVSSSEPKKRAA